MRMEATLRPNTQRPEPVMRCRPDTTGTTPQLIRRRPGGLGIRTIGTVKLGYCNGELVQLVGKKPGRLPQWARNIPELTGPWNRDNPRPSWVDHCGTSGDVLISEPYHFDSADAEHLLNLCKAHNLDFSVSATSQHYPTRTLCIELWPKKTLTEQRKSLDIDQM